MKYSILDTLLLRAIFREKNTIFGKLPSDNLSNFSKIWAITIFSTGIVDMISNFILKLTNLYVTI